MHKPRRMAHEWLHHALKVLSGELLSKESRACESCFKEAYAKSDTILVMEKEVLLYTSDT